MKNCDLQLRNVNDRWESLNLGLARERELRVKDLQERMDQAEQLENRVQREGEQANAELLGALDALKNKYLKFIEVRSSLTDRTALKLKTLSAVLDDLEQIAEQSRRKQEGSQARLLGHEQKLKQVIAKRQRADLDKILALESELECRIGQVVEGTRKERFSRGEQFKLMVKEMENSLNQHQEALLRGAAQRKKAHGLLGERLSQCEGESARLLEGERQCRQQRLQSMLRVLEHGIVNFGCV